MSSSIFAESDFRHESLDRLSGRPISSFAVALDLVPMLAGLALQVYGGWQLGSLGWDAAWGWICAGFILTMAGQNSAQGRRIERLERALIELSR